MVSRNAKNVPQVVWEYIGIVEFMSGNPNLYGMDAKREALHDELCAHFKVPKEATKYITDNLDKYDAVEMWDEFKKLGERYR